MKRNRLLICVMIVVLLFSCVACGAKETGNGNSESLSTQQTESTQETEVSKSQIANAEEILVKTWALYTEKEKFDIMGGHFYSAKLGVPAKYDLTETVDLEEMFCIPEEEGKKIDDAATMIDFYNAARLTAGAYHVKDAKNVESFVENVKAQVYENKWDGETPKKLLIMTIEKQYVVTVYGREELVNEFMLKIKEAYKGVIKVVVKENIEAQS